MSRSGNPISAREAIKNYMDIRASGKLEQGVWLDERIEITIGPFGGTKKREVVERACALGAAFREVGETRVSHVACPNETLPEWLVNATPSMFDIQAQEDAFAWADAIYQPDGLLDRSSKLSVLERREMWGQAAGLLDHEMATNKCLRDLLKKARECSRPFECTHRNLAGLMGGIHGRASAEEKAQFAGTVLDCIDQALKEAGV